jgi:hypothetical protein
MNTHPDAAQTLSPSLDDQVSRARALAVAIALTLVGASALVMAASTATSAPAELRSPAGQVHAGL